MSFMSARTCRDSIVAVLVGALLSAGCTKTREAKLARMAPPAVKVTPAERTEPVRYAGHYVAMWTRSDSKHLRKIPASELWADKGDRLGFARTEEGHLLGIHGGDRFELRVVPADAKFVVWYNAAEVPTQFTKNMQGAGEVAGQALLVTAVAATVVGLLYLSAKNDSNHDCDDDDGGIDLSWLFGGDDDED